MILNDTAGTAIPLFSPIVAPVADGQKGNSDDLDLTQLTLDLATHKISAAELPAPTLDAIEKASMATLENVEVECGADLTAVLNLIQQVMQKLKEGQNLERAASTQAEVSQMQGAAEQAKKAAEDRYAAAFTEALLTVVSGAAQIGMAGAQLGISAKAGTASLEAQKSKTEARAMGKGIADDERVIADKQGRLQEVEAVDPGGNEAGLLHGEIEVNQLNSGLKRGRAERSQENAEKQTIKADDWRSLENATRSLGQSLDAVGNGIGKMAAADPKRDADLADAQSQMNNALATAMRSESERSGELAASFAATVQAAQQALQDTLRSVSSANEAMIHNI